jgi:carbonic anhydrase
MTVRERILLEIRLWRIEKENLDKDYFRELNGHSKPSMLWIESFGNPAPVAELTNTEPHEITVFRNPGGQCKHDDASFMATVENFVENEGAVYIVVCGHSHCQSIRDAVRGKDAGAYSSRWIEEIRDLYERHAPEMATISARDQERKLSELNVRRQLMNLSTFDVIQRAWSRGHNITLLGWYLDLFTGEVKEICSMTRHDIPIEVPAGH